MDGAHFLTDAAREALEARERTRARREARAVGRPGSAAESATREEGECPPPPPPVLTGHVSSFPPY